MNHLPFTLEVAEIAPSSYQVASEAVFFIAGAPIWMSFYSIWLFEVTYGLAQCAISFIFISCLANRGQPNVGDKSTLAFKQHSHLVL
jgi:hypothetical protein